MLTVHDLGEKKKKKYSCSECDHVSEASTSKKQFSSKKYLRIHMLAKHHSGENQEFFKCDQCAYKTVYRSYIKDHAKKHLVGDDHKTFKCDECPYKSAFSQRLKMHVAVHKSGEDHKRFKCDVCPYRTIALGNLKRHVKSVHKI